MPKLSLRRAGRFGRYSRYPVYLNRVGVDRLAFAQIMELELPPGRYQLSAGGWWAREDECWVDLGDSPQSLILRSEALPWRQWRWPKYYRLRWCS